MGCGFFALIAAASLALYVFRAAARLVGVSYFVTFPLVVLMFMRRYACDAGCAARATAGLLDSVLVYMNSSRRTRIVGQ